MEILTPKSLHFGGLWEAAVRSVKRHIYTITKGLTYTFKEYNTLLTEIESVLNSRPLMSIPSDPNEISILTPSYFLIETSLSEPVSKNYQEIPDNRLARWQHISKLKQHFWQRWQKEYLHHLQSRTKWTSGADNLKGRHSGVIGGREPGSATVGLRQSYEGLSRARRHRSCRRY